MSIDDYEREKAENKSLDMSVDPFYSEDNMARLKESIAQMEEHGGTIHEVDM